MTGALNPTDKCLLHIPHKNVDKGGIETLLSTMPKNVVTERKVDGLTDALDDNFMAIEQWVDRFYKDCICDCADGGGT